MYFYNSLFVVVATDRLVYIQDIEEPRNCQLIFDLGEIQNYSITGYIDGSNDNNNTNGNNVITFYLILNESVLIELDLTKKELISENILSTFLFKNKAEGKAKSIKYEYFSKNYLNNYSYTVNIIEEGKIVRTIWKFSEKIITLKKRPKILIQNISNQTDDLKEILGKDNHIAMSFQGGKLRIFHLESKSVVKEYKTNYGNIISIEYSPDGRLLGLGTENDNVYLIDSEFGDLLFCLEGHRNYVTSIIFEEQLNPDDEPLEKNLINGNVMYESIDTFQGQYNTLSSNHKISQLVNKELKLEDFSKILSEDDNNNLVDIRLLRRTRTSTIKSNITDMIQQEENRSCTTYDIYTGSLDGYLGVWRIEHFYEERAINPDNYYQIPYSKDINQILKLEQKQLVYLRPHESIKTYYTDMVQIRNGPLNQLYMFDNILVYLSKRNTSGSSVFLNYYLGVLKLDEVINNDKYDNSMQVNDVLERKVSDLDAKYEKLKSTGVIVKTNMMNKSLNNKNERSNLENKKVNENENPTINSTPVKNRKNTDNTISTAYNDDSMSGINNRRTPSKNKK